MQHIPWGSVLTASAILLAFPVVAGAQADSCWGTVVQGNEEVAACTEDLMQQDCGNFMGFQFDSGQPCLALQFNWEGACLVPGPNAQEICVLVDPFMSTFDGFESCEFIGGMYLGDGSTCGAPVPALPGKARSVLVLVLLAGALLVLLLQTRDGIA